MKAVIINKHGETDQLVYTEAPAPSIGPDEILVKVKACALNHLDIWTRLGRAGLQIPMPHILGSDVSGEIANIGKKVKKLKIGKAVVIAPGIVPANDPFYNTDWESASDSFQILGLQIHGGYAEYVKAPAHRIIPVSGRLSFEEWASVPLVYLTAWHMLVTRAELKRNETVLIHAAGSGVGAAGIQIAKYIGAKVITTVGNKEKIKKAEALGADFVINYNETDFSKETLKLTKEKGADVVLEHIGPETFSKSLSSLKKKGRLVTCGVTSGPNVQFDLRHIYAKQLSISGCYMGGITELRKVIQLAETGKLRPFVDKVFPLKDAKAAQERMLARQNFGKIILAP